MNLPSTKYQNNSREISGAAATIYPGDQILLCDTTSAVVSFTMGKISVGYWSTEYKLYVYDSGSNAGTYNITINAGTNSEGTQQKINGSNSLTISVNNGYAIIRISSDSTFIAETSACCGSEGSIFGAEITGSLFTYTVNGNITGGTAPFTYLWSIKSYINSVSGTVSISIASGGTTHTAIINSSGSATNGMLCCKVTDANGLVTYAYFAIWIGAGV